MNCVTSAARRISRRAAARAGYRAPVEPRGPHVRRSVTNLLGGTFALSFAGMIGAVALGKQVFDITGRELDLGWLGLAEFAPAALLVLFTGHVADRHDRRYVAAAAAVVQTVAAIGLGLYTRTHPTSTVPIFGLVLVLGAARAFLAPAERSMPADIVAPNDLAWLSARFSLTWQVAIIAGPVAAGFLYAWDPSAAYFAMAVFQLVGGLLLFSVDPIERRRHDAAVAAEAAQSPEVHGDEDEAGGLHAAVEGLRFIRNQPVLLGAISLDLFAVLFGGAVALLPAIAEKRLGVGAVGLGWLRAAGGIGAAGVTLVLALRPLRRHVGKVLLGVVALFGVFTIVLGVTRNYAVAFVALAILSGADAVSVFVRVTLLPLVTPPDRRGRVLAVENVFIGASNELGAFESGVAGQILGPAGAVVLGGAATLLVAAGWWRFFPALRDVDEFPVHVVQSTTVPAAAPGEIPTAEET
jgi:MFS family permease